MTVKIGRLAFREEGQFWNAYWAREQTSMKDAILLGSIRLHLACHEEVKKSFMKAMKAALGAACKDATGQTPTWSTPRVAPDNERSGSA